MTSGRTPQPHRPGNANQPTNRVLGDEPPVAPYPLKRGGRAVPDRSREPSIGGACVDTDRLPPAFTEELRSGVETGLATENAKTRQEHGDAVREARGVRTRPVRSVG
jgi:hypothetical protein